MIFGINSAKSEFTLVSFGTVGNATMGFLLLLLLEIDKTDTTVLSG